MPSHAIPCRPHATSAIHPVHAAVPPRPGTSNDLRATAVARALVRKRAREGSSTKAGSRSTCLLGPGKNTRSVRHNVKTLSSNRCSAVELRVTVYARVLCNISRGTRVSGTGCREPPAIASSCQFRSWIWRRQWRLRARKETNKKRKRVRASHKITQQTVRVRLIMSTSYRCHQLELT